MEQAGREWCWSGREPDSARDRRCAHPPPLHPNLQHKQIGVKTDPVRLVML